MNSKNINITTLKFPLKRKLLYDKNCMCVSREDEKALIKFLNERFDAEIVPRENVFQKALTRY